MKHVTVNYENFMILLYAIDAIKRMPWHAKSIVNEAMNALEQPEYIRNHPKLEKSVKKAQSGNVVYVSFPAKETAK